MRRILSVLAGISLMLSGLGFAQGSAFAMYSSSGSSCSSGYPAPYTGGASVIKFFHLADGSTVTITATGAVIKQSPCQTPYREGWVAVSDICNINSSQDLTGRLSPGSSNPYGGGSFAGCSVPSSPQAPAKTTAGSTSTSTASATATVNATAPAVKAAVTTAAAQNTSAVKALPNTGPGNVLLLSGATSAVGTLGHLYYSRRSRRHSD